MTTIKIQLPKDKEAERCVLIVIEDHIGVISKTEMRNGYKYAIVAPYRASPQTGADEIREAVENFDKERHEPDFQGRRKAPQTGEGEKGNKS